MDPKDGGNCYLEYWVCAMRELLGWPEERTLAWARRYDDDLDDRGGLWFYHDPPSAYLVPLLVPKSIPTSMYHVYGAVRVALDKAEPISEADWSAIRSEIERVLNDNGESLSNLASLPPEYFLSIPKWRW